jgi:branched-chain amino acid transport system ATP-binding protein
MSILLRLSNVETAYRRLVVLHGVSLEVRPGQVVALLGSNGAGKTTLLKTVMGFIPEQPRKGTVEVLGRRVNGWEPEDVARLGVAYIPEGRGIFPELTVAENLRLGSYTQARHSVAAAIASVEERFPVLRERRGQLAGTLSGGEQQMLAIARAVLARPRVLLLDEPSLGLAPKIVAEVFDILRSLNTDDGAAILLVEQNARMALGIAHYGYVLEAGRLVLEGPADRLRDDPNVQELYLGVRQEVSVKGYQRWRPKRRWT